MQTEYILKAMDAALAAGKEILNVYNDPSSDFQIERKADNSPLTLGDQIGRASCRERVFRAV